MPLYPSQPGFSFAPAPRIAAITKSDSLNIQGTLDSVLTLTDIITRSIVAGGAGDILVDVAGNAGLKDTNGNLLGATAAATVTMSGTNVSDSDKVTINGTDCAFTAGATDILSATAAVTAINAQSTVSKIVVASNGAGTLAIVTLTPLFNGKFGNALTLAVTGTGVTKSGTTFTGGTGGSGNYVKYTVVAGQRLQINATKVYATGTTATVLVAEW